MADDGAPRRPDLVLFMTDQQRHDQVGYASAGHFDTPNLDALASRGVIFETAYSASTVCVPSRTALLTGLQPHRVPTQENEFALREGFWTVAHALRHAGYETALFGKMHFTPIHADHGFETMRLCEHMGAQAPGPLSSQRDDLVDDYHDWLVEQGLEDRRLEGGGAPVESGGGLPPDAHPTAWVEREVSEFLAARDDRRPLFLVISFPHPHAPYDPPEPYASMYKPADSILPPERDEVDGHIPFLLWWAEATSKTRAAASDERRVRGFLATRRGLIKQIDDAMGRLLARLDQERTLIFFTSDHGDFSGHRGLLRKDPWLAFDDLARVPLVVAGLDVAGGRRVGQLVQSCDLALTCLDYAGVAPPDGVDFDTRSLRSVLDDVATPDDLDRAVVTCTTIGWPTIRVGRYKYMETRQRNARVLFDLEADPMETVNLSRDRDHRSIRLDLRDRLRAVMAQPMLDIPASR